MQSDREIRVGKRFMCLSDSCSERFHGSIDEAIEVAKDRIERNERPLYAGSRQRRRYFIMELRAIVEPEPPRTPVCVHEVLPHPPSEPE